MSKQPTRVKALQELWFGIRTLGLPLLLRSVRYSIEKRAAELRYAEPMKPRGGLKLWLQAIKECNQPLPKAPPDSLFTQPGAVQSWRCKGSSLILTCASTHIELTALSPDIIRVRLNEPGIFNKPFSYAVMQNETRAEVGTSISEQDEIIVFATEKLIVHIHKKNSHIDYLDKACAPINLDAGGLSWHGCWVRAARGLAPDAPVLGLGGQARSLNLRGHTHTVWNTDPGGHFAEGDSPLYQAHPWFISHHQERAFGILFDNSYRSIFDMGANLNDQAVFTAAGGEMRYYFVAGPEIKTVLANLSWLTGSLPLPPLWALGLHQSRWSYKSAKVVQQIARGFRQREIPCDAVHLDIDYMSQYTCFTWNKRRFPDPKSLALDMWQEGFRLVTMIDPGMKADRLNDVAEDGIKKDVFVKFPDGKPFRGPVWPGDCYFPDFTDPSVRIWWGSLHQALIEDGIAGFWNDMNEPSVFSPGDGTMPHTVRHSFERRGANHDQIHNVYGSQMVRATQEGVKALRPDKRPFVLSRSGFTGVQRHAAVWTGDNESSWEHLRLSLSMVFNLGLSGVAFSGPDIGGFYGTPSPELFARWITAAALFPLCRIHTAAQTPQQEPWSFGPEVERISKKMIQLRYRLLPYLYTAFWQASQQGLPIVRPMLLAFQHDAAAQSIDDQFMVGDSLLVAPVLTAATTSRQVYLPPDHTWVDYWTGVYYVGGQTLKVDAPLDHLPIFVMSGATIPHWPLLQSTQHYKMIEAIDHHVFVAAGQSVLYEDDGEGFAYQQGQSRETHLICRQQDDRIVMTVRAQGNYTPPYERINWTIHTPAQVVPQSIVADGLTIANWSGGPLPHSFTLQTPVVQRLEIWL